MTAASVRFALLIGVLTSVPAYADDEVTRPKPDDGTIVTLGIENDLVNGHDDNYTSGVRLAYLSNETTDIPNWMDEAAKVLPFFNRDGHRRWSAEAGQSIFTPRDTQLQTPDANDRPYAGWLYGSAGMMTDTGKELDNLVFTLGVVGPAAGGEVAQNTVHRLIGSPTAHGWHSQLHNEPGVVITYEHKWRGLYEFSPFGWGFDITPSIGGSVGNVYTHAAAGAVARFGRDLPADYGPPLIRPNLPGSDFFTPFESGGKKELGWYLFAGFEGRGVARNIFLDGNSFQPSAHVVKHPLVGGAQAGIAFTYSETRIAYTQVIRSKEFVSQKAPDTFGALTVSWRF